MSRIVSGRDLPWSELRWLIEQGELRRVARGVYASGDAPSEPGNRWRWDLEVALRSGPSGLVVARSAAAALWRFDAFESPTEIGFNSPVSGGSRRAHIRRVRPLEPPVTIDGLDVTGAGQTLLELGAGLSGRRAANNDPHVVRADELVELAVESALRRGDATEVDLLDLLGRCGWRRAGSVMLQEVLDRRPYGAPPTGSYLETRGIQVLRNAGLPTGQRQVAIVDEWGRHLRRVDLLIEDRVIVEFDGKEFHSFEADHEVWSRLSATGRVLLVFTYEQVTRRPRFVADQVERALRSAAPASANRSR